MKKKKMLITLIILLAVGFASVSTTLIITGVVGIASNESDFNIIFTYAELNGVERKDFIEQTKKQTLTFATDKLTTIDEETVLDYEVTNTSRLYDADVKIECNLVDEEENIIENSYINIQYQPNSMELLAGETKSGSITARLIKASTEDGSVQVKCTLNANALERDTLGEEYVPDRGLMIPVNYITDENGNTRTNGYFWDYKENITNVVFEDTTIDRSETTLKFDISSNQDESIMSYLVPNENDPSKYTLCIQSDDTIYLNPKSEYLFMGFAALEFIDGLDKIDTSKVTNMYSMFNGCSSLISLNLDNFNTTKVNDVRYMFMSCLKLKDIDLSSFDTRNVKYMSGIFENCESLISLNLENFYTPNLVEFGWAFKNCKSLKNINLSNFDTSKVTTISELFNNCLNLTEINLSNFDTSNVNDMNYLFYNCRNLTTLDLSNFDTHNVTNMAGMFRDCSNLNNIDVSNFNTTKVTNMCYMFATCLKLKDIDLSSFDSKNVKYMSGIFENCESLTSLNLENFYTPNLIEFGWAFKNCKSLKNIKLSNFDTSKVTTISELFTNCSNLTEIDLSNFDTSNITNMEHMFHDCTSLLSLDIRNFNFDKVTSAVNMFWAMPDSAKVYVKDAQTQNKVLNGLPTVDPYPVRPFAWTTSNVIIAS